MSKSILLVGVGGQGTILTSNILTAGLLKQGYDVKMSEIHGMAQRGGSVTTQIKYGEEVHSPNIDAGEADALIAFEKVEAVRFLDHLKIGGSLVVNDHEIHPMSVLTGEREYPEQINEKLTETVENCKIIDATKVATDIGNARAQNVVLLGTAVKMFGMDDFDWVSVIKEVLPENFHELNIKAFETGLSL